MSQSTVIPFTLENLPIRGRMIRLYNLPQNIPSIQNASAEAQESLQAMLVGVSLLLSDFKTSSGITLQIQDPETHATLAVHGDKTGAVKAYANETAQTQSFIEYVHHGALFALSVEQGAHATDMYQSLIPLEGENVQAALTAYFKQSVQASTQLRIWQEEGAVAGVFIQALPEEQDDGFQFEEQHADDWQRFSMLLDTVSAAEITDATLTSEDFIFRLFHEDGVRVYETLELSLTPANPREKMQQALLYVGQTECEAMLKDGPIVMKDDYTGIEETFTAEDVAGLFKLN